MASYRDLISVVFQDATSHASSSGRDSMGIVLPYFWGPCDQVNVFDRASFFAAYPESLPNRVTSVDVSTHFIDAYAQVKKFFENNGTLVEVYRPLLGDDQWGLTKGNYYVVLKYPGMIPANMLPTGITRLNLLITDTNVSLSAVIDGDTDHPKVLESWDGQFTDETATYQGQFTHFIKVLENSAYLKCTHANAVECPAYRAIPSSSTDLLSIAYTLKSPLTSSAKNEIMSAYNNYFGDLEVSNSSVLVSSTCTDDFDSTISSIAEDRLDLTAVVGVPTSVTFDYSHILSEKSINNQQTFMIACREYVDVFGARFTLNGVGGFVGATFGIAKAVRLNQAASARTYGSYSGSLVKTFKFDDVLNLHANGIGCIFNSQIGPQIFGIHNTLYQTKPNSYFSLWNVSRVMSAILKDVFPLCISAIHTDTAANNITRAQFEVQLDSIIQNYVAAQNLQPDSAGICSAELNTDYLTRGGKELNILLSLHFIGLTEKVNIKVVATDSSVTAEII